MDASTPFEAITLGTVQGLTEFLPVSSSGHLVLAERLLGWSRGESGLAFEVWLHLGTLLSLAVVFGTWKRRALTQSGRLDLDLAFKLAVATAPAAVAWFTLGDWVEASFDSVAVVGVGFLITGFVLFAADRRAAGAGRSTVRYGDSLLIGAAQAVALLPGISRSGSTIAAGILLGLRPEVAVTFAFLMAVPAILGGASAHASQLTEILRAESGQSAYLAGGLAALGAGMLGILGVYLVAGRSRLRWFSYYLWGLGAATLWTAGRGS
ncbi:MAG: undecaprenyl-diphosphate phosphatase [Nitrospirae bacterium]|nr:undecaprenyl-diphosphate phosphatase [Nitrospirota bacterium]